MIEIIKYPIRINRYLLLKGFCSRREADRLIKQKQVKINGKNAEIGQKIEETDIVKVSKRIEEIAQKRVYLAFNKPKDIVTHDPIKGQKSIEDILKYPTKIFPLGRLDKESQGLIILTNDGRITNPLLSPELKHEKEYVVEVNHRIDLNFIRAMEEGVDIGGYKTKTTKIKKTSPRQFHIILTEGKKHQIRRMCSVLKQEVTKLKRIRILNIELGKIKEGSYREIKGKELESFLNYLKIKN